MGKINSLLLDIQEQLVRNELSFYEIARIYNVPLSWVKEAYDSLYENSPDPYYEEVE